MLEKLVLTARDASPAVTHEIITLRPVGPVGLRLLDRGVAVRSLHVRGALSALLAFVALVRRLRSCGPETRVQTWMYHADLMGGLAARLAGLRRVIWNVRRSAVAPQALRMRTRLIVRVCGRLSRSIPASIVVNSRRAIAAHCALGYDPGRFVLIPNGFDTSTFTRAPAAGADLRRQWGIADQHLVVGLVARVEPQKDHANFIAMAERVARVMPHARFVLVGRGIPQDREIELAIRAADLLDRFVLCDQRADIPAVMSALDVFCLSSRTEGFPNVLGEAMACETPCVTTDCGDARDILGDDARVAPPADPQALADRVVRVARMSAHDRERLGREQRQRIVERFAIVAIWHEYLKLYART
jgi:glycosyltransferase involved in cell wall biosynthesis